MGSNVRSLPTTALLKQISYKHKNNWLSRDSDIDEHDQRAVAQEK